MPGASVSILASDFHAYYAPSRCPLRVYLRAKGIPEAPKSAFEQILEELGERHEKEYLRTLPECVDLSKGSKSERMRRTIQEVMNKRPALYRPFLETRATMRRLSVMVAGVPDFIFFENGHHVIRDCKMSNRINEKDHPEITNQLQIYGYLFKQRFGTAPGSLEVLNGKDEIIEITYEGDSNALQIIDEIRKLKTLRGAPYTPVGWSKCNACCFRDRCWGTAVKRRDVATVIGVDQALALALKKIRVNTVEDLIDSLDEETLADLERPWGRGLRRVGDRRARQIMNSAIALARRQEILLGRPKIKRSGPFVMFDVEGLPPYFDEIDKVYLWGLQVYGADSTDYMGAVAGLGPEGDRRGWEDFLTNAARTMQKHGNIPFVHWSPYEKTKIEMYIDRYGDLQGIASKVLSNLLDLHRLLISSIALPLPSYSLKVVEEYVGFKRTQTEYGGDWAMAMYIRAVESQDEAERRKIIGEIIEYNREDLEATWTVLEWFRKHCR